MTGPLLSKPMPTLRRPQRPVNIFELLAVTTAESSADLVLAYFLDPNERHGLGSIGVDALLTILDGAPLIGSSGRRDATIDAAVVLGSPAWSVQPQIRAASVDDDLDVLGRNGIIDLYLTNRELDVAIIIENKINAPLNNPLASYASFALNEGYGSVMLAVLAPREISLNRAQERWVSSSITYSALLGELGAYLALRADPAGDVASEDARRSLDILQQFMEVRKDTAVAQDYSAEAQFIDEFRAVRAGNSAEIDDILNKVDQVNQLTKARSKRLESLVRERLDELNVHTSWEAHGANSGRWPLCYNAYLFSASNVGVELLMSQDPNREEPIFIKAYPGRSYKLYPDADNVPLGVNWAATDEEIADTFVMRAQEIIAKHSG